MERVTIENLDALERIRRDDRKATLFYLDPPYHKTAGYVIPWPEERYAELAELLAEIKGRFILSLNDPPFVRKTFKGFRIKGVTTGYSVGNGRHDPDRAKQRKEVLIHNP